MTTTIGSHLRPLLLLGIFASVASPAGAQDLEIPLSRPGQPVELVASGLSALFVIETHDAPNVQVEIPEVHKEGSGGVENGTGLRRLDGGHVGLRASEEDNRVRIEVGGNDPRRVYIRVPRETSVSATSVNGGDITVRGVSGTHRLRNVNGGVTASDVAGSLEVITTNGDLQISMSQVDPATPLSFVTFNGDVDVTLPPDLTANLELRSDSGGVFTDFDVTIVSTPAKATTERTDGRYRVKLDKPLSAKVGGGGAEVELRTHNGNVHLRKGS